MKVETLKKAFRKIGAKVKISESRWSEFFELDVRRSKKGSFFDITRGSDVMLNVLDVQPASRHLLLMTRSLSAGKRKFLCGHDEKCWFAASIPASASATTVSNALEALKPSSVKREEARLKVKKKKKTRRRNEAFVRQGEWFFIPKPELVVDKKYILYKEPLRRGRGNPHVVDECFRIGGEAVYLGTSNSDVLNADQFQRLSTRERKRGFFRFVRRDARVYVRGRIRHPDHSTVILTCWHLVQPNTEAQSSSGRDLAYLD